MTFPSVLAWIARIVVGGLFVIAGIMKILDPLHFATEIQDYQMVPVGITNAMAYLLPWLEVFTGVGLIVGFWRGEARFLIFVMLVVFTIAKILAEARGLRISCGCFGNLLGQQLETALSGVNGIILNVALCGLLIADFFASKRGPVGGEPRISAERGGNGEGAGPSARPRSA